MTSEAREPSTKRSRFELSEIPLLLAVFLDLVGFGMAFPDIQLRAEDFGAQGWMIGALLSSYFITQILVSPHWGRLSDRIGRKPVLLICTALSALSMLVYAFAGGILGILISRVLAGFAAANVVVANAYVADTTDESTRPKRMGRMGAALTAGLVVGPALGGRLAEVGGNHLLGLVAASASGLSVLAILAFVPHLPPKEVRNPGRLPLVNLQLLRDLPGLRPLMILASASWLVMACLEGTFGRLIRLKLGYAQAEFGIVFGWESAVGVLAGLLLGWIATKSKTSSILSFGYVLLGVGIVLTPFAGILAAPFSFAEPAIRAPLLMLLIFGTLSAFGLGLANPMLNTLCSNATPEERQGEMFGLLQAARSAGFMIGPVIGGVLFDWRPEAPYLLAGLVALSAAFLAPGASRAQKPVTA